MMSQGKIIRALRKAEGLNIQTLANDLEIARSYLSSIEHDHFKPGVRLLRRISKRYKLPVAVFFLDDELLPRSAVTLLLGKILTVRDELKKRRSCY